jgi:hypothetical protein
VMNSSTQWRPVSSKGLISNGVLMIPPDCSLREFQLGQVYSYLQQEKPAG